jgi:hypothetical protein
MINNFMDYLTNYYKNLSEQLQNKVNMLSSQIKLLNEDDWWRDPQFNAPVPQERGVDPARGIIPSIDDVNPPESNPKRVTAPPPTRNPKPKKPESAEEPSEPGDPNEEWDFHFIRDNWYRIWKDQWERLYGKDKFVDDMNKEFERMIQEMERIYKKTRGQYGSRAPISKSWQKAVEHFFKYFVQPTLA